MKKIISVIMIVSLICMSGCRAANITENTAKSFDYDRFQVTQEEIEAHHQKYGKIYCNATVDDDFELDTILIKVYSFANHVDYTADDFEEIGCRGLTVLTQADESLDKPTKSFCLTILATSKQEVLDAVKILEERADIYIAEPNFLYYPA